LFFTLLILSTGVYAQQQKVNSTGVSKVTDVWVVFKTHFDLGFTDLPENVFARYRGEMMDNALSVIEKNSALTTQLFLHCITHIQNIHIVTFYQKEFLSKFSKGPCSLNSFSQIP
jgi:hypothetical protein